MPLRSGHVNAQSASYTGQTLRFRPQQGYFGGESGNSVQISHPTIAPENIKAGVNFAGSALIGTLKEAAPQIYDYGSEYTLMVEGHRSGSVEVVKESSWIALGIISGGGEATVVTNGMVDLTNVDYLVVNDGANYGSTAGSSFCYLVVSTSKNGNCDVYNARLAIPRNTSTINSATNVLNVKKIIGSFYIRYHFPYESASSKRQAFLYLLATIGRPQ